ncbi:hypothetical protein BJV77DRAFT_1146 [Russula vinacea]|nr:hypothetical protein BJV77DRAFT_1146 [Russula vinacea]
MNCIDLEITANGTWRPTRVSASTWESTIMILRILATITGNELAFKRLLSKFLWTAIDLILDALRVTTSHDFADLRGRQGSSRPRMVLLSPVGVGKLGYPVNPLAPNQVDMRLPHDTDGGRDTEKMWYRGMVDVTAIKNSKKALGSRRGEKMFTQWRKGQPMHSESIDIIAVER